MYTMFLSADTAIYVTLAVFITISVFAIGFIILLFANKSFRSVFFNTENTNDTTKPNKKKSTRKDGKANAQSSETNKSSKADVTATTAKRQTRQAKPQATTAATTDKATIKPSTRQAKTQTATAYDPDGVPTVPLGGITADRINAIPDITADPIDDVGISEYPETLDKIPTVVLGSSPISTANETASTTARRATRQSTTRTATAPKATETKTADKATKTQTTKKPTATKQSSTTKTTGTKK